MMAPRGELKDTFIPKIKFTYCRLVLVLWSAVHITFSGASQQNSGQNIS